MMAQHIILNGEIKRADQENLHHSNRAFKYGDGFFESILGYGGKIQYLDAHWNRILKGSVILNLELPKSFNKEALKYLLEQFIKREKFFKTIRFRISFFRSGKGLYTPETNLANYLIEGSAINEKPYELNTNGLITGLYTDIYKPVYSIGQIKSLNAQLFILASIFKQKNNLDEVFILNQSGDITETISSNIFVVKGDALFTPPLESGCVHGVMREQVIRIAKKESYKVLEKTIQPSHLNAADEVFITNAIRGIQWVLAYKDKRYYNSTAKKLNNLLLKEISG